MALVLSTFCYFGSVARTHTHTPNDYNQDSEEANQPSNQTTNQPTRQPANMLAVLPCCDNATKVDDTAHLYCSVGGRRCALVFVLT